jgi:hypothetical protein
MLNIVGIIVLLIVLGILFYFMKTQVIDNFIVFLDEVIIPTSCYNYLVTNGKDFFLFNTKKQIDNITNPKRFKTKSEARKYLQTMKCPVNIPFVDLMTRKKIEDPTVSFQRECNKRIAPPQYNLETCNAYDTEANTLSGKYIVELNKIVKDRAQYANYDQESCMIEKAVNENPELDDTNFKDYFAQYFDRMNEQIPEEYLYISGR